MRGRNSDVRGDEERRRFGRSHIENNVKRVLHEELRRDTSGGLRVPGGFEVKRVKGVCGDERDGAQKAVGASIR